MTFLNSALAFGAAAFVIPIAIHILNRSRFRTVQWGAMHLLESVIKTNRKRFRFDQLILLLVRCLIPVLLAFCIARPLLTGGSTMEGNAPVSLVILLDDSYSMSTSDANGSRFDKAIQASKDLVAATPRGSEVSVILFGKKPMPIFDQPVYDQDAVIRKLELLEASFGACDVEESIGTATKTLASMTNARRELVVISDFQTNDWQPLQSSMLAQFVQQFDAMNVRPSLSLLQIDDDESENVAIESIEFPTRAYGIGEKMAFRVNVRNYGSSSANNQKVVFRVDDKQHSISQISIAANSSTQVLFPHQFEQAGSHVVSAEVVSGDSLQFDNRYSVAVTIWDSINITLVDGDPSLKPLESETDFLSVALTPFTLGPSKLLDVVKSQVVSVAEFAPSGLKDADVLVLANVMRLSDSQLSSLSDFVENGGALLIFPGDRIDLSWYREKMYVDGSGLLPAPFGQSKGMIGDEGSARKIVAQRFEHPSLEFFNERSNGDLSSATIRRWYDLSNNEPSKTTSVGSVTSDEISETSVMARLDNGDPFMLEKKFSDGVVIQMATTCDADWNDLPLRPVYLPMIQQLVTTLATRHTPPHNLNPGDLIAVIVPDSSDFISILTPAETRHTLKTVELEDHDVASFTSTRLAGTYTMSLPDEEIHFVVETSRVESATSVVDKQKLKTIANQLSGEVIESSSQYLEQDRLRRHGREIWKYLLFAFLAFLFLEMVLQQRFARVTA